MQKIDFSIPARRKRTVLLRLVGGWFTNLVYIIQGFLFIPLYLEYLGDRLYGFWLATGGMLAWLAMVDIGASLVTQQRSAAAYAKGDLQKAVAYFWHGAVVTSAVIALMFLGLFILGDFLVDWLDVGAEYFDVILNCYYVSGLCLGARLANEFMQSFSNGLQRGHFAVFAEVISNLVGLVSIYYGLVVFDLGLWALVMGAISRSGLLFIFNLCHTSHMLNSIPEKNQWSNSIFRDYITTTPAVLASKSSGQLAKSLPVVLIAKFISPEATVAYAVTVRVLQILSGLINHGLASVYSACAHFVSDQSVSAKRLRKTMSIFSRSYFYTSLVCLSLYCLLNQGFIVLWMSAGQFSGQLFTILAGFAAFLDQRSNLFVGIGGSTGAIRAVEFTRCFQNLLSILFLVWGIWHFGVIGAPIAVCTAALLTQVRFNSIIRYNSIDLAAALKPLYWLWLPLLVVLFTTYPLASLFVFDSWSYFLFWSAVAALPLGLVLLIGLPELREKLTQFAGVRCNPCTRQI